MAASRSGGADVVVPIEGPVRPKLKVLSAVTGREGKGSVSSGPDETSLHGSGWVHAYVRACVSAGMGANDQLGRGHQTAANQSRRQNPNEFLEAYLPAEWV